MKLSAPVFLGLGLVAMGLVPLGSGLSAPGYAGGAANGAPVIAPVNPCHQVALKVLYAPAVLQPGRPFVVSAVAVSVSQPGTVCAEAGTFSFQGPLVPHGIATSRTPSLLVAQAPTQTGYYPTFVTAQLTQPAGAGSLLGVAYAQVL
jgi:hypothetical protein